MPSAWIDNWCPEVDLTSPAGQMLTKIVVLAAPHSLITLFGSAPLQLCLNRNFLSAELDCIGSQEFADHIKEEGLDDPNLPLYVQVCDHLSFRTSPLWQDRAFTFLLQGRRVRIPHPIDILIAKLGRMDEKDLKAFFLVREQTGHPTEEELIAELQNAVDLYRPGYDESQTSDMKITTRMLWRDFFGKDIDVAAQIIRPALKRRNASYHQDQSRTDHKAFLRQITSPPAAIFPDLSKEPHKGTRGDKFLNSSESPDPKWPGK